MKKFLIFGIFLPITMMAAAQQDSAQKIPSALEKILTDLKSFIPDTSTVPNDKLTRQVKKLRKLKSSFSINQVVLYKIQDDKDKHQISPSMADTLLQQFTKGDAKRWLENATIWVYRKQFTRKEMKQIVKFSRTKAGKKMSEKFPVVILEAVASLQGIYDRVAKTKKEN